VTEPRGRIPDDVLEAIRAALPIEAVVGRSVQLRRAGRAWRGRCPIHGGRSASLAADPQRRSFKCFGCDAHGDVIRWVMETERVDFRQAVLRCAAEAGVEIGAQPGEVGERRVHIAPPREDTPRDDSKRIAYASGIWGRAVPIEEGSPVAAYLAGRGLWPLPPAAHAVLRAGRRRYPAERDNDGAIVGWPAGQGLHHVMVARVSAPGVRLSGVHLTYLAPREGGGWCKLPLPGDWQAKICQGALPPGAAVRLFDPAEDMGVAEGIETALAAARLFDGLPVWAAISAGGVARWVPPAVVRRVTIFADRDKPRARPPRPEGEGVFVARELRARLAERGTEARIRLPIAPAGDYADVLAGRMAA